MLYNETAVLNQKVIAEITGTHNGGGEEEMLKVNKSRGRQRITYLMSSKEWMAEQAQKDSRKYMEGIQTLSVEKEKNVYHPYPVFV